MLPQNINLKQVFRNRGKAALFQGRASGTWRSFYTIKSDDNKPGRLTNRSKTADDAIRVRGGGKIDKGQEIMKSVDVQKFTSRLQDRMTELQERLEEIDEDLDEPADPDAEERATEREGDEVLENLGHSGLAEMRMIQAALGRIKDGTFGVCVACGEPVSMERLEVLPHTPRCKNCA